MEGHALMETEDVHPVPNDLPLFGKIRDEPDLLAIVGDLEDAVVDVIVDRCGGDIGGVVRIEGVDIDKDPDLDHPATLGPLGVERRDAAEWQGL
jgi:hypothetical protein